MEYKVSDVVKMTGITAKTLHYYHRIGLLNPARITESGYRLYGDAEMQRLQQILFYRELDFPLLQIKEMLEQNTDRIACLEQQQQLLTQRWWKLGTLLETIRKTMSSERQGETVQTQALFTGFNQEEWQEILQDQIAQASELDAKAARSASTDMEMDVDYQENLNQVAAQVADYMANIFRQEPLCPAIGMQPNALIGLRNEMAAQEAESLARLLRQQNLGIISDSYRRTIVEQVKIGLPYYLASLREDKQSEVSIHKSN